MNTKKKKEQKTEKNIKQATRGYPKDWDYNKPPTEETLNPHKSPGLQHHIE